MSDTGEYEPAYPATMTPHRVRGKVQGYRVYLRREEIARALGCDPSEIPERLYSVRLVLEPGTRQILVRIRTELEAGYNDR